jgi:hypothetical protein
VVLEPQAIDVNLARRLFELSTRMDDDSQVDFAYGLITGATADDAVQLARNAQQAEAHAAEPAKRFFGLAETSPNTGRPPPGSTRNRSPRDILARLMATYAECFSKDGWSCTVREWSGRDDDAWTEEKPGILAAMSGSRMVFLAGHGDPSAAVGIAAADLEGVDLFPAVLLNGACSTGVTMRQLSMAAEEPVTETGIDPDESFVLRAIRQGAVAQLTGLGIHGIAYFTHAVRPLYSEGRSLGEAMVACYNRWIPDGESVKPRIVNVGDVYPPISDWRRYEQVAACVLYGDPAFVPFPDAAQAHHGLPEDLNPWAVD